MDTFILVFTSQLRKTGYYLQMSKKHNQTEQLIQNDRLAIPNCWTGDHILWHNKRSFSKSDVLIKMILALAQAFIPSKVI